MMSEKSNLKNVDKSFLETLSKSELVNLILEQMSQTKNIHLQHQKNLFQHQ